MLAQLPVYVSHELTFCDPKNEHAVAISLGDGEGSTIGAEGD